MSDELDTQLLTVEEVSRLLCIKPATVYEAAAEGKIPCVRLWKGRRKSLVRFRRSDIEQFIKERTIPAKGTGRL